MVALLGHNPFVNLSEGTQIMKLSTRHWLLILLLASFLASGITAANANEQPAAFTELLRTVRSAETYRVTAAIDQTLLPRPTSGNSLREERVELFMDGAIADGNFDFALRGADSQLTAPIRMFSDANGYFVEREGIVEQLQDSSELPLTAAVEMFAYLDIASNVQEAAPLVRDDAVLTVLTFEIAGAAYAEMMREFYLEAFADELPPNTTLQLNPLDLATTGSGEVWLDANGLPVRQILTLNRPNVTDDYDAIITTTADFRDFDGVVAMPAALPNADGSFDIVTTNPAAERGGLNLQAHSLAEAMWQPTALLLTLVVLSTLTCAFYIRKPRLAYFVFAVGMSGVFLFTPSLQALAYAKSNQRSAAFAQTQAEAQEISDRAAEQQSLASEMMAPLMPPSAPLTASNANTANGATDFVVVCGDGSPTMDSDGDGLTDFDEGCLGTNPYSADTDEDLLSDFAEVEGFTYAGETWFSDPFRPDSNGDGLPDYAEWNATPYVITDTLGITHTIDVGLASGWDGDGDNIPDVWDDDNDNDGVSDVVDKSPASMMSDYVAKRTITIDGAPEANVWQYVNLQIQPENASHLRYSIGVLDWPQDSEGQITDSDNTPEDLRLVPMLQVVSTLKPGEEALYSYAASATADGRWQTLVPLTATSDNGRIAAFDAKMAFPPTTAGTNQISAELVWVVSQSFEPTGSSAIHIYRGEKFRLVGFSSVRTSPVTVAHFATPSLATEDDTLFKLIFGLSSSFLEAETYDLTGVTASIADEALGIAWGLDADFDRSISEYSVTFPHLDRALLRPGTNDFLNAAFGGVNNNFCPNLSGNQVECASAAIATDYRTNGRNLDQLGTQTGDFTVDFSAEPMVQQRSVKLGLYERPNPSTHWRTMSNGALLETVIARYDAAQLLVEAGDLGLGLSPADVQVNALLPYLIWTGGRTTTVAYSGTALPTTAGAATKTEINTQIAANFSAFSTSTKVPLSIMGITDTWVAYQGAPADIADRFDTELQNIIDTAYLDDDFSQQITAAEGRRAAQLKWTPTEARWKIGTMITDFAVLAASLAIGIVNAACPGDATCNIDKDALGIVGYTLQGVSIATQTSNLTLTIVKVAKNGVEAGLALLDEAGDAISKFDSASKLGKSALIVGHVIAIVLAWTQFALTAVSTVDGGQLAIAAFVAIIKTAIEVVFFIISLIPVVGQIIDFIRMIIDLILSVIDIILKAVGINESSVDFLIKALINLFYDVLPVTEPVGGFAITGNSPTLPEEGAVRNSKVTINGVFNGEVRQILREGLTRDSINSPDRLNDSYIRGSYVITGGQGLVSVDGVPGYAVASSNNFVCAIDATQTTDDSRTARCTNDTRVDWVMREARRDVTLSIVQKFTYRVMLADCGFYGSVCEIFRPFEGEIPKPDEDEIFFDVVLDFLPPTLDEFWSWTEITNLDSDGDDLFDDQEARWNTDANNWDSDGDGLPDGFEVEHATLGLRPDNADSDGDTVPDGIEMRRNTSPGNPDEDGDGLNDSAELCRVENGKLVGFHAIVLPGRTVNLCFDATKADGDGDMIVDSAEASLGTSPHAINVGPAVQLLTAPRPANYQGRNIAVVQSGDRLDIGLQLINITTVPITRPLTLCLPNTLVQVNGGTTSGGRTITPESGSCNGGTSLTWPLNGSDQLLAGESISTTLSAMATGANRVADNPITLAVEWNGDTISTTVGFLIDDDNPTIAITDPADGSAIGRTPTQTTYMVRGNASDPTSWIGRVTTTLPDTTAVVGRESWATRWTLPTTDGFYTIDVNAFDVLSHTASASATVFVDGTPPVVTSATADVLTRQNSGVARVDLPLNGTVTDSDVRPRGSEVARVEVSFDNGNWRSADLQEIGTTGNYNWNIVQSLDVGRAQGTHSVRIRAWDGVGNLSPILSDQFIVDVSAPSDTLIDSRYEAAPFPHINTNNSATLSGIANDSGLLPVQSIPTALQGTLDTARQATTWLSPDSIGEYDGGVSVVWLGDVNGDGRADAAVGLPAANDGAGKVVIVNGRAGDWPQPENAEPLSKHTTYVGAAGAGVGTQIVAAGDVNGDSLYDLLIGDASNDVVYLVLGQIGVSSAEINLTTPNPNIVPFTLPAPLSEVAAAGDVNNDGADDFFVLLNDDLYLVNGNAYLSAASDITDISGITANGITHASGVGDVDGDSFDDFIINDSNGTTLINGRLSYGLSANTPLPAGTPLDNAQRPAIPLGDVDADGKADFLLGGSNPTLYVNGAASTTFTSHDYSAFQRGVGDVNADGCNDILLGGTDGNGYLFQSSGASCTAPTETNVVVLTDVSDAAQAPYAAGADLNCDMSSDLLLVPDLTTARRSELDSVGSSFVSPDSLPQSIQPAGQPASQRLACSAPASLYVNDDWAAVASGADPDGAGLAMEMGCDAFATIGAALAAATDNDTVHVQPGVYAGNMQHDFTGVTGVRVMGENAESVIIDGNGSWGIRVSNSADNGFQNVTIRNTSEAIAVENSPRFDFTHSILHDFDNALRVDRVSYVNLNNNTIAGGTGSGDYIISDPAAAPDPAAIPSWTIMSEQQLYGFSANDFPALFSYDNQSRLGLFINVNGPDHYFNTFTNGQWEPKSHNVWTARVEGQTPVNAAGTVDDGVYVIGSNPYRDVLNMHEVPNEHFGPQIEYVGVGDDSYGNWRLQGLIVDKNNGSNYQYAGKYGMFTVTPDEIQNSNSNQTFTLPGWNDICNSGQDKWLAPTAANEDVMAMGGQFCDGDPATADNIFITPNQPGVMPTEVASSPVTAVAVGESDSTVYVGWENGYVGQVSGGIWEIIGRFCTTTPCDANNGTPIGSIVVRPDGDLFVSNLTDTATTVEGDTNSAAILNIARYDSATAQWQPLVISGTPHGFGSSNVADTDNTVDAMSLAGDHLYVAGTFDRLNVLNSSNGSPVDSVVQLTLNSDNEATAWRIYTAPTALNPHVNRIHSIAAVGDTVYIAGDFLRTGLGAGGSYNGHSAFRWSETAQLWQAIFPNETAPVSVDPRYHIGTDIAAGDGHLYITTIEVNSWTYQPTASYGTHAIDFALFDSFTNTPYFESPDYTIYELGQPLTRFANPDNNDLYPTASYTDAVALTVPTLDPVEGMLYRPTDVHSDAPIKITSKGNDLYVAQPVFVPTGIAASRLTYFFYKLDSTTQQWARVDSGNGLSARANPDIYGNIRVEDMVVTDDALWVAFDDASGVGDDYLRRIDLATGAVTEITAIPLSDFSLPTLLTWDNNHTLFIKNDVLQTYNINTGLTDPVSPPNVSDSANMFYSTRADVNWDNGWILPEIGSNRMWRYSPLDRQIDKIFLTDSVLVARPNGVPTAFDGLDSSAVDVSMNTTGAVWVADNWTGATVPTTTIPLVDAGFQSAEFDLYRPNPTSPLTDKGYANHAPDAQVSLTTCGNCTNPFGSIEAAINSGAREIRILPGVYHESVNLPGGVTLRGSDAELVVINGDGTAAAAVSIEGTTQTTLSKVSLSAGVSIEDGATFATISRNLIYNTTTGINITGNSDDISVQNNTLAGNGTAIKAENCASASVVNNALVSNGIGLAVTNCTATNSHNAYWQNGSDYLQDGATGALDGTNVLQNPQFADPSNGNYRLTEASPLIDAGFAANNAPFTPDIGYREFANGDVLVSSSFTPDGDNGGLTFGVDAFAEIQPAVDAASAAVSTFGCGVESVGGDVCERVFTVRVLPGSYPENVTLASHIHLLGSGAEQTTINPSSGTAITIDGDSNVRVAGFKVQGSDLAISNAANRVEIMRNWFAGLGGVTIAGNSSAEITHNTFSGGSTAVGVSGAGNSVLINSNILSGNAIGMSAVAGNSVFHQFNLLFGNSADFGGVLTASASELFADPLLDSNGVPAANSPAIDAADPRASTPLGGGSRADIGYRELTAQPLALLFGKTGQSCVFGSVGVDSNEYGIVQVDDPFATNPFGTVPSSWTPFPLGAETGDRRSWDLTLPALADGTYRLYSRPTDDLGNQTTLQNEWYLGTFINDSTAPTVDFAPLGTTDQAEVEVVATVSDAALNQVLFMVNGVSYVAELRPVSATTVTAHATVPLQLLNNSVEAIATDSAGNQTTVQATIFATALNAVQPIVDETAPAVTLSGSYVITQNVTFSGTATDAESGVTTVAVSLDGGSNWEAAIVNGDNWSLDWQVERDSDYRFYPVRVRATNGADLTTTIVAANDAVRVDNVPPQFTGEASYSAPPQFHYDDGQTVTVEWVASDGDPNVTYFATANMLTRTVPTDVLAGNVATVSMDQPGAWYVHLMAQDSAGNRTLQSVGPWHVAFPQQAPRSAATWTESIIIDGVIDTLHNEWLVGETIDTDSRGDESRTLYLNWDGPSLFLALGGASFPIDGELRIYFGTNLQNNLATESGLDGEALPFLTRYAVTVDSLGNGTLYEYLHFGGGWGTSADARFQAVHANTNSTEIVLPRQFFGSAIAQVVATVTDLSGQRTSAFPTTNPLTGDLTTFYEWRDLGSDIATRDGQPTSADLTLTGTVDKGTLIGMGDSVNYTVAIVNNEPVTQTNLTIGSVSTVGMTSIPFQALPDIAPNGTLSLTLTSQTGNGIPADALTDVRVELALVSTDATVTVSADPITFNHTIDRKAPTVSVDTTETWLNASGTLFGAAVDDAAVTLVEVNDGGGWQAANGGALWQYAFSSSGGNRVVTQMFDVRATDQFGNVSDAMPFDIPVDSTPPDVTIELPTTITRSTSLLTGLVSDTQSGVQRVEVQIGTATNWTRAIVNGGTWQHPFTPPTREGSTISVTVRAIDNVGNVNTLAPQTPTIDAVAPTLQVTQLVTFVAKADQPFDGTILTGTVTDGVGVASVMVTHLRPDGSLESQPVTLSRASNWSVEKPLVEQGLHVFVVVATDDAGNTRRSASYLVTVEMDPTAVSVVQIEASPLWQPLWLLMLTAVVGLWSCWRRLSRRFEIKG